MDFQLSSTLCDVIMPFSMLCFDYKKNILFSPSHIELFTKFTVSDNSQKLTFLTHAKICALPYQYFQYLHQIFVDNSVN